MKIFIAYQIDSPPHAAYATEELANLHEPQENGYYITELEVVTE